MEDDDKDKGDVENGQKLETHKRGRGQTRRDNERSDT